MGRSVNPAIMAKVRPLVEQGLNGTQIADALDLKERDGRWYRQQVLAEATHPNGQGQDVTPPAEPSSADSARFENVPLGKIRLDVDTQARERVVWGKVDEYAERLSEDGLTTFPPVTLFYDGEQYYVGDGFHRIYATKRVDYGIIQAEVREGGAREARFFAAGANTRHGLPRSNGDKRKAVLILLQDATWRRRSDGGIAKHCGVSQPFVSKLRAELSHNGYEMPTTRTVQRGDQAYDLDTSHIGARAATPAPVKGEPVDDMLADEPRDQVRLTDLMDDADNGQPDAGDRETPLAPVREPEAADQEEEWDEAAEEYRLYCQAWATLSGAYTSWMTHVHSGDGARDRQFALEVVKRAGAEAAIHIKALRETADSLRDFAATLQRACQQP